MKNLFVLIVFFISVSLLHAQVGIGTTTPGTTLDVNGGFTIRETNITVTSNNASIPANVSLVRLTGTATGTISITAPAAPNPGQRLIIYNNTVGGFTGVLNGFNIPALQSCEFVYSNSNWQSILPIGSSIIPYASAAPSTVTTLISGAAGTAALIGFGNSVSGISVTGTTLDLTGGSGLNLNYGFSMPRAATVKSITVVFSNIAALNLIGTTITLKAQLYKSDNLSNTYTAIPGASVDLSPGLTGIVSLGTIATGTISGLSIPVSSGTRLLFVTTATASGLTLANTVVGYISGGVSFD